MGVTINKTRKEKKRENNKMKLFTLLTLLVGTRLILSEASETDTPVQCQLCQQMVSSYFARRFVYPFFLWKDTNQWPISQIDFCGQFSETRKQQCIEFHDSTTKTMSEANSDSLLKRVGQVLKNGCIRKTESNCLEKTIGVCSPFIACQCLGLCQKVSENDVCVEPCVDSVCSNCEEIQLKSTEKTCQMCEVTGVMGKRSWNPV
eukprot:c12162_g1_i1.p1 GENE.c12162_g1_i1~~c12162_g1_i1.p1  ORF type:complete len:204 (-),score=75.85 c12162_g1_i1:88-699(-)